MSIFPLLPKARETRRKAGEMTGGTIIKVA